MRWAFCLDSRDHTKFSHKPQLSSLVCEGVWGACEYVICMYAGTYQKVPFFDGKNEAWADVLRPNIMKNQYTHRKTDFHLGMLHLRTRSCTTARTENFEWWFKNCHFFVQIAWMRLYWICCVWGTRANELRARDPRSQNEVFLKCRKCCLRQIFCAKNLFKRIVPSERGCLYVGEHILTSCKLCGRSPAKVRALPPTLTVRKIPKCGQY